jgi:hypothetical protein
MNVPVVGRLTGDDVILMWCGVVLTTGVSCSMVTQAVAGRGDEVSSWETRWASDLGVAVLSLDLEWVVVSLIVEDEDWIRKSRGRGGEDWVYL